LSDGAIASVALGIASAASWGAGDFCGGLAAKRAHVNLVVVGSQLAGAAALLVLALVSHEAMPPLANLVACGAAGLAGAVGLLALYRALAIGRMGVAAPVSGVLSAAVPVAVGAFYQGSPGALKLLGFALALAGVWLVARTDDAAIDLESLGLPIVAGVGFGLFIAIVGHASAGAVYWPLVAARATSLTVLTAIAWAQDQRWSLEARRLPLVAVTGIFDAAGNAFLVAAAHAGRLDVAAVLSSLYPAATVVLAWSILHERLTAWQLAGLGAALAAIALITWP
jgi:drug/metabolite transporter (DMT)-like permease